MDTLLEILLEMIVEGAYAGAASKRVPILVRIVLAVILILLFGGLVAVLFFSGLGSGNMGLILLGLSFLAGGLFWLFCKFRAARGR